MTRRKLFAFAAAPLAAAIRLPLETFAGIPAKVPASACAPLVAPSEVLQLCLQRDHLMCVREDADHLVTMWLDEIYDWPLLVGVHGKHGTSRADLVRDLRRLLALLESGLPIVDPSGWGDSVEADLLPDTAHCTHLEFMR